MFAHSEYKRHQQTHLQTHLETGEEFLSSSEYKRHQQTHLQTHLDKWSNKEEPRNYPPPQGLNPALYKVFENTRWVRKQCYACGTTYFHNNLFNMTTAPAISNSLTYYKDSLHNINNKSSGSMLLLQQK